MKWKKETVEVFKFRYRFITTDGKEHTYTYPYWIDPIGYRAGTLALMMSYITDDGYIPDDENRWKVYPLTAIVSIEVEPIKSAFAYAISMVRQYGEKDLVER